MYIYIYIWIYIYIYMFGLSLPLLHANGYLLSPGYASLVVQLELKRSEAIHWQHMKISKGSWLWSYSQQKRSSPFPPMQASPR